MRASCWQLEMPCAREGRMGQVFGGAPIGGAGSDIAVCPFLTFPIALLNQW
jgi:hypothetical protein